MGRRSSPHLVVAMVLALPTVCTDAGAAPPVAPAAAPGDAARLDAAEIVTLIANAGIRGGNALLVGAGDGSLADALAARGYEVDVAEPRAERVRALQGKTRAPLRVVSVPMKDVAKRDPIARPGHTGQRYDVVVVDASEERGVLATRALSRVLFPMSANTPTFLFFRDADLGLRPRWAAAHLSRPSSAPGVAFDRVAVVGIAPTSTLPLGTRYWPDAREVDTFHGCDAAGACEVSVAGVLTQRANGELDLRGIDASWNVVATPEARAELLAAPVPPPDLEPILRVQLVPGGRLVAGRGSARWSPAAHRFELTGARRVSGATLPDFGPDRVPKALDRAFHDAFHDALARNDALTERELGRGADAWRSLVGPLRPIYWLSGAIAELTNHYFPALAAGQIELASRAAYRAHVWFRHHGFEPMLGITKEAVRAMATRELRRTASPETRLRAQTALSSLCVVSCTQAEHDAFWPSAEARAVPNDGWAGGLPAADEW